MKRTLPIYLTKHRKRWSLSLGELGFLLDVGKSTVCNYEGRTRPPSRELLVAAEVVFGERARDLFPEYYGYIEDRVMARAKKLDAKLRKKSDPRSKQKLKLLRDMVKRAQAQSPEV